MTRYAYLDKGGVLHMVKKESDARQYSANGKIEATEMNASSNGYPIINIGGEEKDLVCYDDGKMYYGGNKKNGILTYNEEIDALIGRLK